MRVKIYRSPPTDIGTMEIDFEFGSESKSRINYSIALSGVVIDREIMPSGFTTPQNGYWWISK